MNPSETDSKPPTAAPLSPLPELELLNRPRKTLPTVPERFYGIIDSLSTPDVLPVQTEDDLATLSPDRRIMSVTLWSHSDWGSDKQEKVSQTISTRSTLLAVSPDGDTVVIPQERIDGSTLAPNPRFPSLDICLRDAAVCTAAILQGDPALFASLMGVNDTEGNFRILLQPGITTRLNDAFATMHPTVLRYLSGLMAVTAAAVTCSITRANLEPIIPALVIPGPFPLHLRLSPTLRRRPANPGKATVPASKPATSRGSARTKKPPTKRGSSSTAQENPRKLPADRGRSTARPRPADPEDWNDGRTQASGYTPPPRTNAVGPVNYHGYP